MIEQASLTLLRFLIGVLIILISLYNILLGVISFSYFICTELVVKRQYLDLMVVIIILVFGAGNLNMGEIIKQPFIILSHYKEHGLFGVAAYEITMWQMIYKQGLIIILIIPLALRMFYDNVHKKISQRSMYQRLRNKIKSDTNIDGILIGDSNNKNIIVSDKELNQHCLIIGTTGAGKTTTILNFVESAAKRGLPLIYLDGKGSFDLVDKLQQIADCHKRTLKVFSLRPKESIRSLAGYNPFSSGGATEWKNRIMALFSQASGRGQEHFSLSEENYINFVASVLAKLDTKIDLRVVLGFLEQPNKLVALAHEVSPDIGIKLAKLHSNNDVNKLVGDVIKLLELFIYSDYGRLFITKEMDQVINLRESILNNEMILFLFDTSTYPEDTRKIAKMVINDLNSSFSDFTEFTKCYCIFDEFASYASDNLAETVSLQRSKGMHAIIGTQSITTVKLKAADTKRIAEELIACCNTYIVQTLNHADDAEILSKVMGTRKAYQVTTQLGSKGGNAERSSVKLVDEFKVHPQALKELSRGEAIIYRKAANLEPIKIKVRSNIN